VNDFPPISVLIRTFNSAKTLGRAIEALDRMPGDEIIVVDSGSTDHTLQIAEEHGCVILRAPGRFHYSKSLNIGFRAAKNEWVNVISSHHIPVVPDFLAAYRQAIAAFPPDIAVAYGPSTLSGEALDRFDAETIRIFSKEDYDRDCYVCSNRNALYRRSVWEKFPFDEAIITAEDHAWLIQAMSAGYRLAYVPKARGMNCNQGSLRHMFRKGYYDSRCFRKPNHRPMSLWHLGGALKNLTKQLLQGKIDTGNWIRNASHAFGQFFGTRMPEIVPLPPEFRKTDHS